MSNQKQSGESFLHARNANTHKSREVEDVASYMRRSGEKIPNSPAEKLGAHIRFLNEVVNDGLLTGDQESISRQVDYLTIRTDEVPESYFDLQKKIARERGHGDIDITSSMRDTMIETIREEQTQSLESWADYLTDSSNDTTYPDWFKKYAFEAMTKLGPFDKEKSAYTKRSRGTTTPYADLNAEALSYVYDAIDRHALQGVDTDDERVSTLVNSGSFAKLYAHAMMEVTPASAERREITAGSWTKYDQIEGRYDPDYDFNEEGEASDRTAIDNEDAMRLAKSLQGHGTGWCTAGTRTAAHQLTQGDFYVYNSQDKDGNDTVPRIAIRMEHGRVAEVRGIEHDQNLEGNMTSIAMDKLATLEGGEEYLKAAADMKRLTEIDEKNRSNDELSVQDIWFLRYADVSNFGYQQDPRISEILESRDYKQDLDILINNIDNSLLAEAMISEYEFKDLIDNIDSFDLSADSRDEIAFEIIRSPAGREVANNLEKFNKKISLAQQIVHSGDTHAVYALSQNLSKIDDQAVFAQLLIDTGEDYCIDFVISHIDKFNSKEVDNAALAQILIDQNKQILVANYFDKLELNYDDRIELIEQLVQNRDNDAVNQYLDFDKLKLEPEDLAGVAVQLFKKGQADKVIDSIDSFKDKKILVQKMIDSDLGVYVLWHIDQLGKEMIDQKALMNSLISGGSYNHEALAQNLDEFDAGVVDQRALATYLIKHNGLSTLVDNFDKFDSKNLDESELVQLTIDWIDRSGLDPSPLIRQLGEISSPVTIAQVLIKNGDTRYIRYIQGYKNLPQDILSKFNPNWY